jgi:hypothetical protein
MAAHSGQVGGICRRLSAQLLQGTAAGASQAAWARISWGSGSLSS